jgi:hypothetical protein
MFFTTRKRETASVFVHPLDPTPKTAILVPGFVSTRNVRVFPHGWDNAAKKFAPAAVAGTFDQLLALADKGGQFTHAVINLAWHRDDLLTQHQSDQLWDAFGVPIFEQYLGPGNVLLAYECEAHGDFHATPAYTGPILKGRPCACGNDLPTCTVDREALVLRATA